MASDLNLTFYGTIKDGAIYPDTDWRPYLKAVLPAMEGQNVKIIVRAYKRQTSSQMRYYHGVVVEHIRLGLKDLGNDFSKEKVHALLKTMFLTDELIDESTGEVIADPRTGRHLSYTRSLNELSRQEFSSYIDTCIRFAAETLTVAVPHVETG